MTTQQYSYGTGYVLPWYPCRVIINSLNIENIIEVEATSTSNVGAGTFTAKISDPNGDIEATIDAGADVQIYLSQDPVSNRAWAGFLEQPKFVQGDGHILTLTGRENAARLLDQVLPADQVYTIGTDAATILKGIMAVQSDFTTNNVPASFGLTGAITFRKGDSLVNCIKKTCDWFNLVWWIDIYGDMHAQLASTIVLSSNILTLGDNLRPGASKTRSSELLCNYVTVDAASGVTAYSEDATSQAQYGKHSWQLTAEGLAANADCQTLANTYKAKYKDPITFYETDSSFLDDVFPNYFIAANDPTVGLSGNYQIYEAKHSWKAGCLATHLKLGTRLDDEFTQLAKMFDRLRVTERKAFTGV